VASDQVVAEMTRLIAAVTGVGEADAAKAAAEVVADAADQVPGGDASPKASRAFNPRERRDPHGKWSRGGGEAMSLAGAVGKVKGALADTGDPGSEDAMIGAGHQASPAVQAMAQRAATAVAAITPGTGGAWNGRTVVYPESAMGSWLGRAGWDGTLNLRQDVAQDLEIAFSDDPAASIPADSVNVLEHEMIHLRARRPEWAWADAQAYSQHKGAANIEEGFTQAGSEMHAPEFIGQLGLSDRMISQVPGAPPIAGPGETLGQYAGRLATPKGLDAGGWHHYRMQTRMAAGWTRMISAGTGQQPVEVADEINAQGTADKPAVMARQLLTAEGLAAGGTAQAESRVANLAGMIVDTFKKRSNFDGLLTTVRMWAAKDKELSP